MFLCGHDGAQVTGMPRAIKRIQLSDVSDESHDQRAEKERKSKQHRKRGHQSKGTRHGTGDGSGGLRPGEELGRGKKGKRKVNEMTYEMCLKEVRWILWVPSRCLLCLLAMISHVLPRVTGFCLQ